MIFQMFYVSLILLTGMILHVVYFLQGKDVRVNVEYNLTMANVLGGYTMKPKHCMKKEPF